MSSYVTVQNIKDPGGDGVTWVQVLYERAHSVTVLVSDCYIPHTGTVQKSWKILLYVHLTGKKQGVVTNTFCL